MPYTKIALPGINSQAEFALYTMLDEIDAGAAAGELTLPATPDYTCTVSSADDTSIWKAINIPGWGRVWHMSSTALNADIDTVGALDDANIPGSELTVGDFFYGKLDTDGSPTFGTFVLRSFTDGTPATNLDLSNISSLGLANTD